MQNELCDPLPDGELIERNGYLNHIQVIGDPGRGDEIGAAARTEIPFNERAVDDRQVVAPPGLGDAAVDVEISCRLFGKGQTFFPASPEQIGVIDLFYQCHQCTDNSPLIVVPIMKKATQGRDTETVQHREPCGGFTPRTTPGITLIDLVTMGCGRRGA